MKKEKEPFISLSSNVEECRGTTRLIVWLTIFLQFFFPLAGTFTPTITHARNTDNAIISAGNSQAKTRVYTLSEGENVQSVAKKYRLTVEELRKLNQFRTFAHGFSSLKAGDELDVPASLTTRTAQDESRSGDNVPDEQEQKVAGLASQAGSFLSNSPDGRSAESLAVGMATGEASSRLQQVLGRFGTARVQLGADENFSLKNSQFDLLFPIWERDNALLFTQGSLHRTDDRTQANLGLGTRYFTDSYMLGANTFLDYDLSRDHSRLGLGLEYSRDFLKLSANGYQRLSNWKDSGDFDDYQERPANGWDVRAEGWLPALPQLGGKVVYEQYYGDEVALFDKDNRQNDPHAFTVGMNYTPVPLVTMSVEQREGQSDENETRFGLQLNYQLGTPWLHQIDPDGVAALHTLTGSRYDLVDRNNNIVLEYRKKDLIQLNTADLVTGNGGEKKSLGVSVNSKYGVKRIDWSAGSLIAAGGKIVANSATDYEVLLPLWQAGTSASNTYMISGVAVDNHGNRSNQSDTQVTVNAAEISVVDSSFLPESPIKSSPTTSYLPADGQSSGKVILTLVDGQKQPVDVAASDISLNAAITALPDPSSAGLKARSEKGVSYSALVRKSAGVFESTVTAGTKAELLTLTPIVRKTTLNSARFFIVKSTPDGSKSTFAASPKTVIADNSTSSTLTLVAKDVSGNALSGIARSLTVSVLDSHNAVPAAGKITVSSMKETATPGTYTATLKGTLADTYTVKPQYNGSTVGTLSDTVILTAGTTPDGSTSTFSIAPKSITADNVATSLLTFTAKDAGRNPVSGMAGSVTFQVKDSHNAIPAADKVIVSSVTETGTTGVYTATLKGSLADTYTVRPLFNGSATGTLSGTVILTAGSTPDAGLTTFTASPASIAADNIATSTLTLAVKDASGNPIGGIAGSLSLKTTDSQGREPAAGKVTVGLLTESATPGVYTTRIKGMLAGTYTVKPQYNGGALGTLTANVTLTAGTEPDGGRSTFVAAPVAIVADNVAVSTLTLKANDYYGNPVSGIASALTLDIKDNNGVTPAAGKVTVSSVTESAIAGTYTATLKGLLAGVYKIKPQFNGGAVGSLNDTVTLTAGTTPDGSQSTFAATPKAIAADNAAMSTLTFTAKDAGGNAIRGIAGSVTFLVKNSQNATPAVGDVTVSSVTETGATGIYTATLKGSLADTYTVKP